MVAVVAVGLMVFGLSITVIRKGRPMESDVGSNREMKKRGIECAAAQIRRQEAERTGKKEYLTACGAVDCEQCGVEGGCK